MSQKLNKLMSEAYYKIFIFKDKCKLHFKF